MTKKILIGAHTSAAGGAHKALLEGKEIGATTIQLFTSNQKQWKGKTLDEAECLLWQKTLEETGISHVMSHDSYLINLGSPNPELFYKSHKAFQCELERCHALKIPYLNFHPGCATKSSEEECLERIVESLLSFESFTAAGSTRLLLETTAGQGTSVGNSFEHIAYILNGAKGKIPLGVTIDTCHIFAAGYDLRTPESFEKVLHDFDRIVGLEHLYAFHLNDSVKGLGSRVDRHAPLGKGEIGIEAFRLLMTHPKTKHLPKYLETPDGPELWKEEISMLKTFAGI